MSNKHLSLKPSFARTECDVRQRHPGIWYYEESVGLCLVICGRNHDGILIAAETAIIPWRNLRNALARKDHR